MLLNTFLVLQTLKTYVEFFHAVNVCQTSVYYKEVLLLIAKPIQQHPVLIALISLKQNAKIVLQK